MADRKPFGIVARFESPAAIYHACEAVRDAGYKKFDAHTPFPVHGLEKAMGVGPSILPYIVLGGGITGATLGFTLQWWVHAIAYPQNISGKPWVAFQAYVPITFEVTVLLSAFACFFGMWGLNNLPLLFHPVMQARSFPRATDDGFLISIESSDPLYHAESTRALLSSLGGLDIEEVQP